jgi:uncharacterized protein (TIRG00374 family)
LKLGAGLAVAAALLWFFFRGLDLPAVWESFRRASPAWIAGSLVFTVLHYVLRAWRWRLLLSPIRAAVPFRSLLETVLAGYAVTFIIPGRLGEVARPALLARREKLPLASTMTTVGLDRFLDGGALVVLLIVFLQVAPSSGAGSLPAEYAGMLRVAMVWGGLAFLVVFPVGLWLLARFRTRIPHAGSGPASWRRRLAGLLRSFLDGLAVLQGPKPLSGAVLGSLVIWMVLAAQAWFGIKAFGIELPYTAAFALISFLAVGIAIPTPAGAGGFHVAGQACLVRVFAVDEAQAGAATLALHLISVVPAILMGGWVLVREGVSLGELFSRGRAAADPEVAEGRP